MIKIYLPCIGTWILISGYQIRRFASPIKNAVDGFFTLLKNTFFVVLII